MTRKTVTADVTGIGGGSIDPFDPSHRWQHTAWTVTLRYDGRRMTVPFYTGSAHGTPTASDVLECVLSDASGAEQPFEDWAADYGYDTDSRRAERTYNAVQRQTAKLRKLLGDDYDAAVWPDDCGDSETVAARLTGQGEA